MVASAREKKSSQEVKRQLWASRAGPPCVVDFLVKSRGRSHPGVRAGKKALRQDLCLGGWVPCVTAGQWVSKISKARHHLKWQDRF